MDKSEPLLEEPAHKPSYQWVRHVALCLILAALATGMIMHLGQIPLGNEQEPPSSIDSAVEKYGIARMVQTARGNSLVDAHERWVHKPDLTWTADFESPSMPAIDLDDDSFDQQLLGFGGAFTETSATVFYKLPKTMQEDILNMYFSLDGLGYTMGRTHINSCDFSLSSYSFDDVSDDFDLVHFDTKVQHDVDSGLIPLIKQAQEKIKHAGRSLRLLATPWSPPEWMKKSGDMKGLFKGGPPKDIMDYRDTMDPKYYPVWGKYIAKWVSSYKALDIPIWAITVQNEPGYDSAWESNMFTARMEAEFLGLHLGPAMAASNPEVAIFAYDWDHPDIHDWAKTIHTHPNASKYVSGIAWHWYRGDLFSFVEKIHLDYPQALLLPSEETYEQLMWHPGTKVEDGDWTFGEGYGHDIIGNLNAGAIGWIDWNLILDPRGGPNKQGNVCDAAMMANTTTSSLFVHPQYYYIGHFSKYIFPGSRRIKFKISGTSGPIAYEKSRKRGYGVCNAEDGLQATAWQKPDKQIVLVVLNCGDAAIDFKIKHWTRALKAQIPAHGIQTYLFEKFHRPA